MKKTAIITGASRGIGRGIAKVFADQGANVAFTYSSSAEAALELEKEINNNMEFVKGLDHYSETSNSYFITDGIIHFLYLLLYKITQLTK